jgi:7-cyano-7-deazaguanine synthase in queuosine biosynthesis
MPEVVIQRKLIDFEDVLRALGREPNWSCTKPGTITRPCGGCQSCRMNALVKKALRMEAHEKKVLKQYGS